MIMYQVIKSRATKLDSIRNLGFLIFETTFFIDKEYRKAMNYSMNIIPIFAPSKIYAKK